MKTNEEIEAHILGCLAERPCKFTELTIPDTDFRVFDRALQRLRKKGLIAHENGKWHLVKKEPPPLPKVGDEVWVRASFDGITRFPSGNMMVVCMLGGRHQRLHLDRWGTDIKPVKKGEEP